MKIETEILDIIHADICIYIKQNVGIWLGRNISSNFSLANSNAN